jgi:ABC-type phosphate/phosphonate transport system substrate-binding protein
MSREKAESAGRIASLAMYRDPPIVAVATHALWAYLRDRLRERGLADVPEQLEETIAHDAAWLDPRLLFAQTCGYPFAKRQRGRVRLIATPVYDHPGCEGATNGSFVIVRADSRASSAVDLRGATAAINDPFSNSGMNLLRRFVAPHALDERFFGRVIESGSHIASIASVARNAAQVAAIDCVTYGNLARFAPERLAGIRILAETAKMPGLPFITRATASDGELAILRDALARVADDPAAEHIRETLGLRGFIALSEDAYDVALRLEREAVSLGYPDLA